MDWDATRISIALATATCVILLPLGLWLGRYLAIGESRSRPLLEAVLMLPLLLPPTVVGFYLLLALGGGSTFGRWLAQFTGLRLVFTFEGLLFASLLVNLPFMVQPVQRAFAAIPHSLREAAWVSGLSRWRTLWKIELPLAWPGILGGIALTFAHTLGEFGVVLMVGGSIAGQTRTLSIAIYDRVQAFDNAGAGRMSLLLVAFTLLALWIVFATVNRSKRYLQDR
ncbi:MAG TPA: molybdate ABC transporter permease subunit [Burkholderiaceae bacterium]|nr:molybdate ABC transporter permease subunit [Burkholderiaceae bacterium]HQR68968.1 molybdate ABC transporter permease subunit [Burkholderiaceae bacterium]